MKSVRFIDHYGLLVFFVVGLIGIAAAFWWHWTDPKTLEALATVFVTAVLALVTWQYVRTTQKTLELFKEQWDYHQQVGIEFGLKKREGKPWIRIANTGGVRVFVSKAVFHQRGKHQVTRNSIRAVKEGENYGFFVPPAVYKDEPHNCDVGVTLHYRGYGKTPETISKAFRIEMLNGKVYHIKSGVHEFWTVACPKCNQKHIVMNTDDLETYDAAYQREIELKDQLKTTCPQHQSPWMDTVETIRERNRKEKEKGILE
jgi:membrane protein implicated in regulation of membrane protease activity